MWLTDQKPGKPPPEPPHVHVEALRAVLGIQEQHGVLTPAGKYLQDAGPKLEVDRWGAPLPLSPSDQDRLDRLFALMSDPGGRGRALIVAGMLAPDEVEALQAAFPEVWSRLCQQAFGEMSRTPPPYARWAEETLNVLFGVPAAQVLTSGEVPQPKEKTSAASITPENTGTQADRREVAVREQRE